MTRKCTICSHPERNEIDMLLLSGTSSLRDIADQFGISKSSLERHKSQGHISEVLAKAEHAAQTSQGNSLLAQVQELREKSLSLLKRAEESGDLRTAAIFLRELREQIRLLAAMALEVEKEREKDDHIEIKLKWNDQPTRIYCRKCGEAMEI